MNRLPALLAALLLAGCAHLPPPPSASPADDKSAVAAIDLGAKFRLPREGKKRDRATNNAEFHLQMEADEAGPPRAHQIFRAQAERETLVRGRASGDRVEKTAGLQPSTWQALGPSNVGGRVRALAFDPRNSQRILAGTASGGLWMTDNAGASWRAHFDFLPNLSVTTVVFDPANPNIIFLGTGEASAGLVGVGAFKSTDGGVTWQHLAATNTDANADWRFVNRLAIHPTQTQFLLAGVTNVSRTTGGIYRTADGGGTWAKVSTMKALDIAFDPNNPANAVAGLDDGTIGYSRDGGLTWTRSARLVETPSGRGSTARAEVAYARSQPGKLYASVDNLKGQAWQSVDGGATWTLLSTPAHLNNQGDYDNAIWVDPLDANHVAMAGLDLYRSQDGGTNFTQVSDWRFAPNSPHADHHALVSPPDYGPGNPTLYTANDGGVYRTANIFSATSASSGNGWQNLNNGLAVTQFYSGAGKTAAGGRVIGGTQDNGSLMLTNGAWVPWAGGDGGHVAVDPTDDRFMYGEYVYLSIQRSTNGGLSRSYICNGITEALPNEENRTYCGAGNVQKSNFIAPFILDPNNSRRLLGGANSLWVTDDAQVGAPVWRAIKAPSTATDNFINAIAVAEGNSNVTWVGHNNGEVYRSIDALSGATWTRVGQGTLPARAVQRFLIDRDDANHVYVAVTGFTANNLWETRDGGATWSSATGNLPQAPVFDVKRHPINARWLYAATSVGVFASENGGATWSTSNEGPANIRVRELFWKDNATLVAATYGRGMFQTTVAGAGAPNYQDLWWGGATENGWGMSITQHADRMFVALYVYDAQGRAQWAVMPGGTWSAGFTTFTGALYVPSGSYFGNYNPAQFTANAPAGTATLNFTGAASATLTYTLNGSSGTKALTRQSFGAPDTTPVASFADLWWGGTAQDGWGVAISQQYRTLFPVWYTYDASGRTQWYVIPGGTWTAANVYTGAAFRTTGSPWAGAAYNPATLAVTPAGTVTFTFTDANTATMAYSVDGVTQTKTLTRQPF